MGDGDKSGPVERRDTAAFYTSHNVALTKLPKGFSLHTLVVKFECSSIKPVNCALPIDTLCWQELIIAQEKRQVGVIWICTAP